MEISDYYNRVEIFIEPLLQKCSIYHQIQFFQNHIIDRLFN